MAKKARYLLKVWIAFSLSYLHSFDVSFDNAHHTVNFSEIKIKEFIKFVSKVCKKTFVFKDQELDFNVSFISGQSTSTHMILEALQHILYQHHFKLIEHDNYFVVEKLTPYEIQEKIKNFYTLKHGHLSQEILKDLDTDHRISHNGKFHIYKLQYHIGSDLLKVIKQVAASQIKSESRLDFVQAVESLQWVESTNSLIFTSDGVIAEEVFDLIKSLDQAQKQVFIEVLVLETEMKDGLEFGLEWAGKGKIDNKLSFGFGNFQEHNSSLSHTLKSITPSKSLSQTQIPLGRGFDLGVIGDLILHKGKIFTSLASLVSALQKDGKATIVLNQKILTQDNKTSTIFVGDNIPFTGSVIETIGAAQQTTSNIEYRDIGVNLHITPLLGDANVITLDIKEDITEAREDLRDVETKAVNGIITSKTNMVTRAHVPDNNFLVLSGMVKNSKIKKKTGIPCLGGLPFIGAAFSKTKTSQEKKNIIVFVRPQIIHNFDTYRHISNLEQNEFEKELDSKEFTLNRENK